MRAKDFFNCHPVFRYEEFQNFMKCNGVTKKASVHQLLGYYHKQGTLILIRQQGVSLSGVY